jgi:hypothetical protein
VGADTLNLLNAQTDYSGMEAVRGHRRLITHRSRCAQQAAEDKKAADERL